MRDALAPYRRLIILVLALLSLAGLAYGAYALHRAGVKAGDLQCTARQLQVVVAAEDKGKKDTAKNILRSTATGSARESGRRALDALYDQLDKEAHDAPTDPADACVLPTDRLRLWNAANDGATGAGAAATQPDHSAPAAAARPFWQGARLGGQPPPGSAAIPPVSPAAVPAAGLPPTDAP